MQYGQVAIMLRLYDHPETRMIYAVSFAAQAAAAATPSINAITILLVESSRILTNVSANSFVSARSNSVRWDGISISTMFKTHLRLLLYICDSRAIISPLITFVNILFAI